MNGLKGSRHYNLNRAIGNGMKALCFALRCVALSSLRTERERGIFRTQIPVDSSIEISHVARSNEQGCFLPLHSRQHEMGSRRVGWRAILYDISLVIRKL